MKTDKCLKMSVLIAEMERLKRKYSTVQGPYSIEKIGELLEKAGLNITNNKENLLRVIQSVIKPKTS